MDLVVVVPTFNEAENIEAFVAELLALGIEGLRILVVDDNSPDGTGQLAESLAARHPEVCRAAWTQAPSRAERRWARALASAQWRRARPRRAT